MAAVFLPDPGVPARGRLGLYSPGGNDEQAPQPHHLGLPSGEPVRARLATLEGGAAALRDVPVCAIALTEALPCLLSVPVDERPAYRRPPDSLRAWALAARLAVRAVAGGRLVPTLARAPGGGVHGVWKAWLGGDRELEAVVGWLAAAMPHAGHALAYDEAEAVWDAAALLQAFFDAVADLAVRQANPAPRGSRPRERLLPWTARWAEALADPVDAGVPLRDDAEELVAAVAGWHSAGAAPSRGDVPELRLRAPDEQDGRWRLDLGLRTVEGTWIPAGDVWNDQDATRQEALLAGLGRCARIFPPIDAALEEATPEQVVLDLEGAWTLLSEAAPALAQAGAILVLPDELARDDLRVRLRVDAPEEAAAGATPGPGDDGPFAGALAGVSWEVALGGEPLSDDELDTLLGLSSPLVRWRDRWVRVDESQLRAVRDQAPPPGGGQLPLAEALALGLAGTTTDAGEGVAGEDVEVVAGGGVAQLLDRLAQAVQGPPAPSTPEGFVGELRPYQRRGVAWLQGMDALRLGAVLADDMGLGKGIQLIAYLLTRPAGPHLVVCPTSVVGNWQRELARFAPSLAVTRFHGPDRPDDLRGVTGVVVTSYGTLRRSLDALAAVDWDVITLDEAQHVKNPATAGARAVRRLRSRQTVALTGTPLENRMSELWALLDVTNRGLLGSRAAFNRRFAVPIEQRRDGRAAARLRRLVSPFLLRREKSDPTVVAELPPKIERTVPCALTVEQARLYRATVERAFGGDGQITASSAMERRGRVLALITALKQICNHPAQLLRESRPDLPGRSGKLAAAREIVAEAVEAGDQVLVFTQYVAMGHLLVSQLGADLGTEIPFLHGGVSGVRRDRMVAAFQDETGGETPPVLVVSLRAGGTGLNLTAATHVLHYDRWWNPAVEDQATDRTHRIGQHRTVEVHKLVTAGTIEERIAEVIERKRELSASVVGAGEAWITELGDAELAELVALSPEASIDELDEDWDLIGPDVKEAS
ncbi:MAG TPA: DEAD/DEAH box helicase [Egibacteraceae bacterium]|nr:DEAD/DEAH box helicase [Egibacteraceae bacterium]